MIRSYKAVITADRYPLEFSVEGTSWATAAGRAIRTWAKRGGKGSRTDTLTIKLVRTTVPTNNNN